MPNLISDFLADLRGAGKSPETLRGYGSNLQAFAAFYKGEIGAISVSVVREYLRILEGRTPATIARHRAALSAFLRWCVQADLLLANPVERLPKIKLPQAQPRAMPAGEVQAVLKGIKDKRDRLIFHLMADTGARVSEILSLRMERIRLPAQEITIVGKGGRERTLYLIQRESYGMLRRYLRAQCWLAGDGETITGRGLLFRPDEAKRRGGHAGAPIHYSVIQKAWQHYSREAGVHATIHQLRHTYATRLINEGKPVEVIQKILGHRNLQTTQRYAVVSDETVRRALEEG
ncbi:Tyrosine recombinase XerC [compost metagenome]